MSMNISNEEKIKYLKERVRLYYPQGDSYYAYRNKKDKWHFGYSNDYPLQHGSGENFILPDKMIDVLILGKNFK